jgi:hypothetical protein
MLVKHMTQSILVQGKLVLVDRGELELPSRLAMGKREVTTHSPMLDTAVKEKSLKVRHIQD